MASFLQYFAAVAKKQWIMTTTAKPIVFTKTPLAELSQRSLVDLDMVPFILAKSKGSLFDRPLDSELANPVARDISGGRHTITGVSVMNYIGSKFYRAYLSKDEGSFIHLGVNPKTNEIEECRIYQPYNQIEILYKDRLDQIEKIPTTAYWKSADFDIPVIVLPETYSIETLPPVEYVYITYTDADGAHKTGVPKDQIEYRIEPDESLDAEFWLLDNPDPNVGGMIGCPVMQGKTIDNNVQYTRTWAASNSRIGPVVTTEHIIDGNGDDMVVQHTMMHYSRQLEDNIVEYMLVSCCEVDGRAYILQSLGLDIPQSAMTIFGVSAK